MSNNEVDQGIKVNANAGVGQERVGEPGASALQKANFPPAAGGPGTGSGADATSNSEDQRARSGPDVYARTDRKAGRSRKT